MKSPLAQQQKNVLPVDSSESDIKLSGKLGIYL